MSPAGISGGPGAELAIPAQSGGTAVLVTHPAERVRKPDVKNSVVLALALVILSFTAISGVAIWAAASFDGGVPGVTGPADGHRDPPVIPPADRTRPPTAVPGSEPAATPAHAAPATAAQVGEARANVPQSGRDTAAPVDWTAVRYPLDCSGVAHDVQDARPLTADNRAYVVQVRCAAGSGTAPDAVYLYSAGPGTPPALTRTLLDAAEDRTVKDLDVHDGRVTATLLGWSAEDVPRCCPDIEETRVLTP